MCTFDKPIGVGQAGFIRRNNHPFPYLGKSNSSIQLGPESESVRLLDFKHLGIDAPGRSVVSGGER